jgi:DNA-binding transcriptional ArsR family regulator
MSIRISFPTTEQPGIELESHALTELFLSLGLVRDPGRNAALAPWVRRVRARLPKPVRSEISALSFMIGPPYPAEFLFPECEDGDDVPRALASFSTDAEHLKWNTAEMAEELVDGTEPEREAAEEAIRDPKGALERLVRLLQDYWHYGLAEEWPKLDAQLRLARAEAELHLAGGGIAALLARSTRRARLLDGAIAIRPSIPIDFEIPLAEGEPLPVVLSMFAAPYVFTRISENTAVVLPAPAANRDVTAPSLELVRGLNAIADPTRLTLLRLVAAAPRSTRELSQLMELSESTVSKHMRQLAAADLVRGVRHGYYVLYRLVPERAAAASDALRDFLDAGTDSPTG